MEHDFSLENNKSLPDEAIKNRQLQYDFSLLTSDVHCCDLCPRMEGRARVFGSKNGHIDSSILFIAEAPGRLGADRVGIPLSGDQTGRNFEALLQVAQLDRDAVFITNAVLCNPRNEQGNNASPNSVEIKNCSQYLSRTIELLQPRFVITLGQVALHTLRHIEDHPLILSQHAGIPHVWHERWLIPLYHPGPRARIYRPVEIQKNDFLQLGIFIRNEMNLTHSEPN